MCHHLVIALAGVIQKFITHHRRDRKQRVPEPPGHPVWVVHGALHAVPSPQRLEDADDAARMQRLGIRFVL